MIRAGRSGWLLARASTHQRPKRLSRVAVPTLHHCAGEEPAGRLARHVIAHGDGPSALPEQGHVPRIAPEIPHIPLHPLQRRPLVLEAVVARRAAGARLPLQSRVGEEAHGCEAVLQQDDDGAGRGCEAVGGAVLADLQALIEAGSALSEKSMVE